MNTSLKAGLVGWPVAHSMSPVIQRVFMKAAGIPGEYFLYSVEPFDLPRIVHEKAAEGFNGLNVTIPHKRAVIGLCSFLSPSAEKVGAVNTLVFGEEGIEGHNTDAEGFSMIAGILPAPFFIIGRGGAALAVQAAVASSDSDCILLGRGESIPAERLGSRGTIVNATPLGWNDSDGFPVEIPSGWTFADLNYNPGWEWRNAASRRGISVITGERMLVEQAACSFALWTGYTPSEEQRLDALEKIKAELNE